jgi:hypothetical protein
MSANAATRRGKKAHAPKPGSWEATHPTLSLRTSLSDLQRVKALEALKGVDRSDILREGLRLIEIQMAPWIAAGFGRFLVRCTGCGEPLLFDLVAHPELGPALERALSGFRHSPPCAP